MFINSSYNYYLYSFSYDIFFEPDTTEEIRQTRINITSKINSVCVSNLISNAFVTPLLNLFNIHHIYQILKRTVVLNSYKRHKLDMLKKEQADKINEEKEEQKE